MIKIVICSAIKIYLEGLELIFGEQPNIYLVGLTDDNDCAMQLASSLNPDVLLLDINMRESHLLAKQITAYNPSIRIVAISVGNDEDRILNCVEVGIQCYVPHEASKIDLIDAVTEAAKGEYYCSSKIVGLLLRQIKNFIEPDHTHHQSKKCDNTPHSEHYQTKTELSLPELPRHTVKTPLTKREQQIAKLLAQGYSNKQIAKELYIEVSTVKNHVHNLLVKLNAKNRCQAVMFLQITANFSHDVSRQIDLDQKINPKPRYSAVL